MRFVSIDTRFCLGEAKCLILPKNVHISPEGLILSISNTLSTFQQKYHQYDPLNPLNSKSECEVGISKRKTNGGREKYSILLKHSKL